MNKTIKKVLWGILAGVLGLFLLINLMYLFIALSALAESGFSGFAVGYCLGVLLFVIFLGWGCFKSIKKVLY